MGMVDKGQRLTISLCKYTAHMFMLDIIFLLWCHGTEVAFLMLVWLVTKANY